LAAAGSPDGRRLALVRGGPTRQLQIADLTAPTRPVRTMLSGLAVTGPTWSADSRWLLVSWNAQDQWLFVPVAARSRILAAFRATERFPSRAGPLRVDGWCCAP
jgi:Tol biopolymer transport system component